MGMYNWKFSSVCASSRVVVTATVSPSPEITTSTVPATICPGSSSTINVSSSNAGYSYLWAPGNLTGATQVVYPATSTTYSVTATDNGTGCTAIGSTSVTVNAAPSAMTITPAAPSVVSGAIQSLAVTGGNITDVTVFSENFNGATNSWTTVNNSTGGTPANAAWTLHTDGFVYSSVTYHSNDNSQFYMTNGDSQGSGGVSATELISPVINTTGYSTLTLKFWHYFRYIDTDSKAFVEVSTDGGTTWNTTTPAASYTATQGASAAFVQASVDLTSYAGQSNLKIRFRYADTYGWYWCIDNVSLTGTAQTNITWSPYTNLYLDNLATAGYNGEAQSTVYCKPTATRTYTATAVAPSTGCAATQTVTVTLLSPMSVNGTAVPVTCFGTATGSITTSVTGGVTPFGYLWSNGAVTANLTGIPAGTYSVTVTDAGSATATGSWTVSQPSAALGISGEATNAYCPYVHDGSIAITVSGGTSPYGYSWSNGATTQNVSGLSAGTYTVVVTDAQSCSQSHSFAVGNTYATCDNLSLTGTYSSTVCYTVSNIITLAGPSLSFVVTSTGNVTLHAGIKIDMKEGTTVASGGYLLAQINTNQCPGPAAPVVTTMGQSEATGSMMTANFTLFPNPTNGNFTLVQKGERTYGTVKVEVYAMNGERVLSDKMIGEKSHEFSFSDVPSGLYFVKVVADDYVETIKLVKSR